MKTFLINLQTIAKSIPTLLAAILIFLNAFLVCPTIALSLDINVLLMETTFKITGRSKKDISKNAIGTVFIVGRPMTSQPGNAYYVMVTAGHVLDSIAGDDATLFLRKKEPDGVYKKFPFPIKIRDNGKPIFVRHQNADVAVQYLKLPSDLKILPVSADLLATDKAFEKYEIHPGDELLCLGYPFAAEANSAGFPILRSGKIASYPIIPAKTVKTFLFDFEIFGGNSGGPVYMSSVGRVYQNTYHLVNIQLIAGLVSQQANALPQFNNQPLALAVIIPAQFIAETINLLPDLDVNPGAK